METNKIVMNTLMVILLYFIISIYAIDFKVPLPKWVVVNFHEPYAKVIAYLFVYYLSYHNPIVSLLFAILVIMIHANDVLVIKKYEKI